MINTHRCHRRRRRRRRPSITTIQYEYPAYGGGGHGRPGSTLDWLTCRRKAFHFWSLAASPRAAGGGGGSAGGLSYWITRGGRFIEFVE